MAAADGLSQLADAVTSGPPGGRRVVLVDGGSGSGKTELGTLLAAVLGAQLVSLDDIYPGWDGLEAASAMVRTDILERSRWRRWDWAASIPAELHDVDPARDLVIEGSGCLSAANRELATFGVWLDVPESVRKPRALERDGELYRPHWHRWAEQERAFFDRERPDLLADLVLD